MRGLLFGLIDYAGLFPPARLPMTEAVDEYRRARVSNDEWLLGCFLCPASRLDELAAVADNKDPVGVIVDSNLAEGDAAAVGSALTDLAWRSSMVEIPVAADGVAALLAALRNIPEHVPVYIEPPRGVDGETLAEALRLINTDRLAGRHVAAKVRCGGLDAAAFPTAAELAGFVVACRDAGVPFKATAGLHHAVRHTDPATGFEMHGFLNLLVACALALRDGLDQDAVAGVLDERDERRLIAAVETVDSETVAHARRQLLASYGSCSFTEPVDDLRTLGLLPEVG